MLAMVSEASDREEGGCELRYPQSIGYEGRYDPRRGFHQITNSSRPIAGMTEASPR